MGDFHFYGLDEAGEIAFTERLNAQDRASLRKLAAERLAEWHGVEIWDGPMCIVRLRRRMARPA